jgi:DNA-binding SARP family transcriptional activator
MMMVWYSVLGPLEVRADEGGDAWEVGPPFAVSVLLDLLVNRGTTVSIDRLADELWGWDPPPSSRHAIQAAVSKLRARLGAGEIETVSGGYRMEKPMVDMDRATALAEDGHRRLAHSPGDAAPLLAECLSLWRGEPFHDVAYADWAQPVIRRLDEVRLGALVDLAAARVALGKCAEVVGDLEALVLRHPELERAWALLVIALCKCGRRGDAIQALRDAAERLDAIWGLPPSEELLRLQEMVYSGADTLRGPWIDVIIGA